MSANTPPKPSSPLLVALLIITAIFGVVWLAVLGDKLFLIGRVPHTGHFVVHLSGAVLATIWLIWMRWPAAKLAMTQCVVASGVYVVWWQSSVFICDALGLGVLRASLARWGTVGFFFLGLSWFVWWIDWSTKTLRKKRAARVEKQAELEEKSQGVVLAKLATQPIAPRRERMIWWPFDLNAWYYGRAKKLNQSIWAISVYSFSFIMTLFLLTQMQGCQEIFELPAGGGAEQQVVQQIKVQKIIRKKFVINPYSAISFNVPKIEDSVQLNLDEATKHQYEVGYGQGKGAGYEGGSLKAKARFIRLQYNGGDWDQDFGIGGDENMLNEYHIRTGQKVEKRTESRQITQLKNFKSGPAMVYITGERNISVSNAEIKILREYLLVKHGMIFADNGGSRHWENQFFALMNRVMPDVKRVPIPLDDVIHRRPRPVPFLPLVAVHGARKEAMGWYKDGRWVCYYHPGDIGDAWADGHAGVKPEVWEACYQLGTNVMSYANLEFHKWTIAQKKE